MSKYNELTKRLLEEGYTKDHYPDYVKIGGGNFGHGDPLDNFYGGFEYTREYRSQMVFVTGCGRLVKGSELSSGFMSYRGIDWTVENNCPVITCPMWVDSCDKRFSQILGGVSGGALTKIFHCDLRRTDAEWTYEQSLQKVKDDESRRIQEEYEQFAERVHGHVCHWHMLYNYFEREWKQIYNPNVCARMCQNVGRECNLTHRPLSKKRGNVFYDVKVTRIHNEGDLFDGQEEVSITRGIRFLEHPTSIDICHEIMKRCKNDIVEKARGRYSTRIFLDDVKVEVINIKVEQRESRDLMQDLADLKAGIELVYDSDQKKQAKTAKKERRQQTQEKKIQKLEKKLLDVGYENLDDYSIDKIHADKWLGPTHIRELIKQREKLLEEKANEPKQMSLFDMEGFT